MCEKKFLSTEISVHSLPLVWPSSCAFRFSRALPYRPSMGTIEKTLWQTMHLSYRCLDIHVTVSAFAICSNIVILTHKSEML